MKKNIKAMCINRYKDVVGGVLRALVVTAGILFVTGSCDYKDLVVDNSHQVTINVVYEWDYAPEADPEGMCIFFYNADDGTFYDRWDFPGMKGGQIKLDVGTYNVITYNNDTEGVLFSGTDGFDNHTAFTREGVVSEVAFGNSSAGINSRMKSRADYEYEDVDDMAADDRVVINPDMMWGVNATKVEVTEETISYTTTRAAGDIVVKSADADMTLTLYPQELIATYTYEVFNVTNIQYAYLMFGKLSGLASSLNLSSNERGPETFPVPFDGRISRDDGTMSGTFLTFGDVGTVNTMIFYVMLTNGDNWYNVYDVTDQVKAAEDPMHVHIVIDGMDLPLAISNGEGFHPSVDDWQSENHDINMGTGYW